MIEIIPNWHPIFVHFTVALLSLSAGLFVVTPFVKSPLQEQWLIVARWTLWFGAGLTIITGLTGLYAYNTVDHDTPSHLAMTDHRNWAIVTISLFLALAAWSIVWVRKNKTLGTAFVVCIAIAGAVLGSTAWHGGEVVYRHGVGVMSLPKAEGDGHNHVHGESSDHKDASKAGMEASHNNHSEDKHQDEMKMDSTDKGKVKSDHEH